MADMQATREQQRAKHALAKIKTVAAKLAREYKSYAESLPTMVVVNGLGQACATLLAQAKGDPDDAHRLLYDHLEDWLCVHNAAYDRKPLIEAIIKGDQDQYVRAQFEALAYLTWLKKFAQAQLSNDLGSTDGKK
jgi:CRISPR-associated protein Cmr5